LPPRKKTGTKLFEQKKKEISLQRQKQEEKALRQKKATYWLIKLATCVNRCCRLGNGVTTVMKNISWNT